MPLLWPAHWGTGLLMARAQGTAEPQEQGDPFPPGPAKSTVACWEHY